MAEAEDHSPIETREDGGAQHQKKLFIHLKKTPEEMNVSIQFPILPTMVVIGEAIAIFGTTLA